MLEKYFENRKEKRIKKKLELKEQRKKIGLFREYFELIAETLIYVFFVMAFLLQTFVIPTGSMIDNLLIGDHLLVDKISYSNSLNAVDSFLLPQREIERGMIVTFRAPHELEKEYVKRVIALPGETIKIIKQQVYITGKPLEEEYKSHYSNIVHFFEKSKRIIEKYTPTAENQEETLTKIVFSDRDKTRIDELYKKDSAGEFTLIDSSSEKLLRYNDIQVANWYGDNFPLGYENYDEVDHRFNLKKNYRNYFVDTEIGRAFKVPEGHYFCMGDNRDNSLDSRFWGPVPEDLISGKPWRIYWSFDSTTKEYLTPGILHKIKDLFKTIINFFPKTRWKRTFKKVE